MLSRMSAVRPWPFGGISYSVWPRYVVEIGSTHSDFCAAKSCTVRKPPFFWE
jgi:hypothetical protein